MSDDDIHDMMDRAHYAEIREQRLRIEVDRLKAENARLREALTAIASFDEVTAKKAFATYGSIALFDESDGVRIARDALAAQEKSDE